MKNNIQEVAQPLSQGEKNFKDMHKAVNHKDLVPGVTDQEHVFNGSTKPYDNKFLNSYKPGQDIDAYDKDLKINNKVSKLGYEKAEVEEAMYSAKAGSAGKDLGAPGKNFAKIAKDAAKRYGSKKAGKKVAGAILAKMRAKHMHNEEVEPIEEKKSPEELKKIAALTPPRDKITKGDIIAGAKMNEDNYDDTPEEVSMVRTELRAMVVCAQGLLDNMSSDMHIEPWVQSKIAIAKSMVCSVHDYMLYSDDAGQPSDTMQAPMPSPATYGNFINRMGEEVEELDEISLNTKMKAYSAASQPDADVNYGDKVYDQSGRFRAAIIKKHGEKAGQHADSKAHTDAYGRSEPGKTSSDYFKKDKLKDAKPASAMRITKSGVINKQDVESKKKEIKSRISMEEVDLNDEIEEAMGSMIDKTHKDIRHQASFGHKDIAKMRNDEKQRLHGNQYKLDKDHDGQLTKKDFDMLHKIKKEEIDITIKSNAIKAAFEAVNKIRGA